MNEHVKRKAGVALLVITMVCCAFGATTAGNALAQSTAVPEEMRTVFMIGDIDNFFTYPLMVYIINGNELLRAEVWSAWDKEMGPIGLAVDETNERLFVSYESGDFIDVYNARNMNDLGDITLQGTSDLAGMDVHEPSARLLVVDRWVNLVWEFDTTTYQLEESWTLENCEGAIGIDTADDTLYVTCGHFDGTAEPGYQWTFTNQVNYYNLNTHAYLGTYELSREAVAISVSHYPEPVIYATGFFRHEYVIEYYPEQDLEFTYQCSDGAKGITVNPAMGYVYAIHGFGGTFLDPDEWPTVKVFNMDGLTVENSYVLDAHNNSPTDMVACTIPFGGTVSKELVSHPDGIIQQGDEVIFEITIENRHTRAIGTLPLMDTYDTDHLTYNFSVPASANNIDDGTIDWNDVTNLIGHNLQVNQSTTVEVHFTADPDPCDNYVEGINIAQMHDAKDNLLQSVPDAAGRVDYRIECGCEVNSDCDDELYCNGLETCTGGSCLDGTPPCPTDDGNYCNGDETAECDEDADECGHTGNPCPADDNLYCNGDETADCNETTNECGHTGNPCAEDDGLFCNGGVTCSEPLNTCLSSEVPCQDDGEYCNGAESCNENNDECDTTGDPCEDDGIFCNGQESCVEENEKCVSSGNPCPEGQNCDETNKTCTSPPEPDDDDDNDDDESPADPEGEEDMWPEGDISGGCCGC